MVRLGCHLNYPENPDGGKQNISRRRHKPVADPPPIKLKDQTNRNDFSIKFQILIIQFPLINMINQYVHFVRSTKLGSEVNSTSVLLDPLWHSSIWTPTQNQWAIVGNPTDLWWW